MDDIGSGAKLADVVINGLFHNSLKEKAYIKVINIFY